MPHTNGRTEHESDSHNDKDTSAQSNRQKAAASDYRPAYTDPNRRAAEDRENAFNTLAWLVEGASGLYEELRHNDLGLSENFWVHAYAARREALLALKAVIDELVEDDKPGKEDERQKRRDRRGGINIEF